MDFLNRAFAQLNDLFRSMTPGGRITTGLLLVVAVVSVGYLFQSQVGGGDDYLFVNETISAPTLDKMVVAFSVAKLNDYTLEGSRVKVPHSKRFAYLAALADGKALPPNFGERLQAAGDNNLLASPKQREEQRLIALEQEMADVIGSMKGVERASVLIDQQRQPGGIGLSPVQTASVAAQGIGGLPLDEDQVDKIRYYVAAAVAGMKPENVTIADTNGRVHIGSEGRGGPNDDGYLRAVRQHEQDLTKKLREALAYIPGVTVTPTVILANEKDGRSVEEKIDPKPVTIRAFENNRETTSGSATTGGAPGLPAQNGGANAPASLGLNSGKGQNETTESKTEQVNAVSKKAPRRRPTA